MTGISLSEARSPAGMRLYAIGDVHGRLDLLTSMHGAIRAEIARDRPADWRIVHVGDYVDRGPDSCGAIELILAAQEADSRVIALAGNHDVAFADFMAGGGSSQLFARFGGAETAASYGVDADFGSLEGLERTRRELADAVPGRHHRFLATLPRCISFGDYFFCHAGIRPGVPLASQDPEDLIWIRREFLEATDLHPKVIVHGHTPHSEPEIRPNRINLDTGAFDTGRLTGVVLDGAEKRLIEIGSR